MNTDSNVKTSFCIHFVMVDVTGVRFDEGSVIQSLWIS